MNINPNIKINVDTSKIMGEIQLTADKLKLHK